MLSALMRSLFLVAFVAVALIVVRRKLDRLPGTPIGRLPDDVRVDKCISVAITERVTAKRPWRDGERSPWAGEETFPTIVETALMYPARAVGHAFFAAIGGAPVAALLAWGLGKLWDAFPVLSHPTTETIMIPLWVAAFVGLWCEGMYHDVRGRYIFTSD